MWGQASGAAISPFGSVPEDEFPVVDPVAPRLCAEAAPLIHHEPAAAGTAHRDLQGAGHPAGIRLLPVRQRRRSGQLGECAPEEDELAHGVLANGPRTATDHRGSGRTPSGSSSVLAARMPADAARSMSAVGNGNCTKSPARLKPRNGVRTSGRNAWLPGAKAGQSCRRRKRSSMIDAAAVSG